MQDATRREFLRRTGALGLVGGAAAPWALNLAALAAASAQTGVADYRALVCVFLYGGNDAYNTVLATDADSWAHYTAARTQAPDPIALAAVGVPADRAAAAGLPARLGGVLPLAPAVNALNPGRGFALHPLLVGVRDLFAAQRLAIVPNVGPMMRPTRKEDYRNPLFPKPANLFSHNDQQSVWQALAPEGAVTGWGGRMADLLVAGGGANAVFTGISASGNAVWLAGRQVVQYHVSTGGAIRIAGEAGSLFGSTVAFDKMRAIMRSARSAHLMEQDHAGVVARSIDAEVLLDANLPPPGAAPHGTPGLAPEQPDPLLQYDNPLTGSKATNTLAQQMQIVARTISASLKLGVKRQVLFVSLGGFDTHDSQNRDHADLMARLGHALGYFDRTLVSLGLSRQVTTFTASDFGRTFVSNGDGTDHGWGAHHFVMGGAVRGGDVAGVFPQFGISDGKGDFTSPHQIRNGSMLPTIAVDQYAATLGRWLGLDDGQLLDVFPNLAHFDPTTRNLGFMA
jgi:uncharacterized protein (DUF1501 family)